MPAAARSPTPIAFAVAAAGILSFSGMDAVMKQLTMTVGVYNAMFWRMWAGVALGGLVFFAARAPRPTRAAMRIHVTRGVMSSAMALLFFWARK